MRLLSHFHSAIFVDFSRCETQIIIVEDDCIQLKTLSDIIKQIGGMYQVYEAVNTAEALKIAQREMIDLFYIDINVKNESGLKFALEIRKIESYRLTWIIFVKIFVNEIIFVEVFIRTSIIHTLNGFFAIDYICSRKNEKFFCLLFQMW